jgi:hypothetical protein
MVGDLDKRRFVPRYNDCVSICFQTGSDSRFALDLGCSPT